MTLIAKSDLGSTQKLKSLVMSKSLLSRNIKDSSGSIPAAVTNHSRPARNVFCVFVAFSYFVNHNYRRITKAPGENLLAHLPFYKICYWASELRLLCCSTSQSVFYARSQDCYRYQPLRTQVVFLSTTGAVTYFQSFIYTLPIFVSLFRLLTIVMLRSAQTSFRCWLYT